MCTREVTRIRTVLASGSAPGDLEPAPWRQVVDEVRTRYLGPERRAGSGTYSHPKERRQDVLARSPFSQVDTARWDHTLTRTVDEVIGWTFSLSYSSPAQLGAKKDPFEQDLRRSAALLRPLRAVSRGDPHRGDHRHQALTRSGGRTRFTAISSSTTGSATATLYLRRGQSPPRRRGSSLSEGLPLPATVRRRQSGRAAGPDDPSVFERESPLGSGRPGTCAPAVTCPHRTKSTIASRLKGSRGFCRPVGVLRGRRPPRIAAGRTSTRRAQLPVAW